MWAEEGDDEIMAIPLSLYALLLNKAEKYDQLIAKMKEVEGNQVGVQVVQVVPYLGYLSCH